MADFGGFYSRLLFPCLLIFCPISCNIIFNKKPGELWQNLCTEWFSFWYFGSGLPFVTGLDWVVWGGRKSLLLLPCFFSEPGRPFAFPYAPRLSRAHAMKVVWEIPSCLAAYLDEISSLCQALHNHSNASGLSCGGRPKRTPFARATAIPSAWRWRVNSRSVWAT